MGEWERNVERSLESLPGEFRLAFVSDREPSVILKRERKIISVFQKVNSDVSES